MGRLKTLMGRSWQSRTGSCEGAEKMIEGVAMHKAGAGSEPVVSEFSHLNEKGLLS